MATFVYAPAIRVHIQSEKSGTIDVSDDITNWQLTRRSNNPSSFNFTLQNAQRKYDGVFKPSDRLTVELKRVVWVTVFTGSINSVPIFSSWPRALALSASCSLKKLQFWPWDPTTTAAIGLVANYAPNSGGDTAAGDGGLSNLITASLTQVTDWDPKAIHIGAVPNDWFKWAQNTEQQIDQAASMAAILGSGSTLNGTASAGNLSLKPGNKFGTLTQAQLDIATQVYEATLQAAASSGINTAALQDRAATIALMVAGAEDSYSNGTSMEDHTSLGVFQQQNNWGSVSQRENVQWATTAFLKGTASTTSGGHIQGLFDKSNWQTAALQVVAQDVQGSAFDGNARPANLYSSVFGGNYLYWQPTAQALVTALRAQVTVSAAAAESGTISTNPGNAGLPTGSPLASGLPTGSMLANVAYTLVQQQSATNPIQYTENRGSAVGDDSAPDSNYPTFLDCSSLVDWVYFHTTGTKWAATSAASEYEACAIKPVPHDIAPYIQGCLMYGTGSGGGTFSSPSQIGHTGISLGNGHSHVAAHDASEGINISDLPAGLSVGGLAPGIDYRNAGTTAAAVTWLTTALKTKCQISTVPLSEVVNPDVTQNASGGSSSDPFAELVSALVSAPAGSGTIFGGPRQLINNQPFLPWIGNLTNSSMRAYSSAPNGDFIAWFPDYFNVWGTAAVMDIQLIELQDFTVEWSDQQIVTHEFVLGSLQPLLDGGSGSVVDGNTADYTTLAAMLATQGIATMQFPQIFQTIYGKPASQAFVSNYLQRFGARPNVEAMPNIQGSSPQEFYMALWLFMKHWAEQFTAVVPMTFMPELWPGMIIQIQEFGFQAYVSEVVHTGSYGQNGQFTTQASIIAPAPIDASLRGSLFGMLDIF